MTLTRKLPIDFAALARETGLKRGNVCHHAVFGWCIQNTYGENAPDIICINPPAMEPGETFLKIEKANWCFYK